MTQDPRLRNNSENPSGLNAAAGGHGFSRAATVPTPCHSDRGRMICFASHPAEWRNLLFSTDTAIRAAGSVSEHTGNETHSTPALRRVRFSLVPNAAVSSRGTTGGHGFSRAAYDVSLPNLSSAAFATAQKKGWARKPIPCPFARISLLQNHQRRLRSVNALCAAGRVVGQQDHGHAVRALGTNLRHS